MNHVALLPRFIIENLKLNIGPSLLIRKRLLTANLTQLENLDLFCFGSVIYELIGILYIWNTMLYIRQNENGDDLKSI